MTSSTEYYRKNKKGREKKKAYDTKLNARPEQIRKRTESNKKRREAKRNGTNVKNKDYDHSVNRFVSVKTNRGRRGGSVGDRNARGSL